MDKDTEERAADLAQIAVFNACKECHKAVDACEPVKVEVAAIKDRVADCEDGIKEIKSDIKNAMLWVILTLLGIFGAIGYIVFDNLVGKHVGG